VSWFQNVARPTVAVIILVMCAPGEHHLAVMAGWSDTLAWGMPGCLVVYTGIAAVVATKRAKGAPGKRTAVAGAILALALAMSAQPVSHLFVTSHWSGDPVALVVIVSCIPPLVAGHLWHLAASPSHLAALVRDVKATVPVPEDVPEPVSLAWDRPWDIAPVSVPVRDVVRDRLDPEDILQALRDRDMSPDAARWTPETVRDSVPVPSPVRSVRDGSVTSVAVQVVRDNPGLSSADLADIVSNRLPDVKPDTVRKAVYRARRAA
jgi:hypothetical protein